ncbi:rod shape-determining protein MreC [soil metagenome]
MHKLFAFIYRYRAFLVFVILEVLCAFLIVRNNSYHSAAFYTSSNQYAGMVLNFQQDVADYFRLSSVNNDLARENADLRQQLHHFRSEEMPDSVLSEADSLPSTWLASLSSPDLAPSSAYSLIPAKVINNSIRKVNNFMTLNMGTAQGIEPGMGVISADGVVGRVKAASAHYATVTSLLHSQTMVSAKVKRTEAFGSIQWEGDDYGMAALHFIPRHINLAEGDTIVTSGFNAIFPEGVMVGTIRSFAKEPDKSFFTVQVDLSVDFSRLSYVYVVKDRHKEERDQLEVTTGMKENE